MSWDTFALTDTRWLVHAVLWSLGLLSATLVLPWLFTGYLVVFGLSLLAAFATGYTNRGEPAALPPATLLRYILVDSIFVAFATHPVFFLIQIALAMTGFSPRASGPHYGLLVSFCFVCGFYLCLGIISHLRSGASPYRTMPPVAAAVTAALLIITGYPQFSAHRATQQARDAGVSAYERETGRATTGLSKLRIGNSLHGFDGRVYTVAIDRHGRLLVSGGFEYYAGRDARGLVRLLPDGQRDTTFAAMESGDPGVSAPSRVLLSPDESIVISTAPAGSRSGLTRLQPEGMVDPRFRLDMSMEPGARAGFELAGMQPDGRLLLVSASRFLQDTEDACLLRFDKTGVRDVAFSSTAMEALYGPAPSRPRPQNCSISKVSVLATGHLLVEGSFPKTGWRYGMVRLDADGSLDAAFSPELENMEVSLSVALPGGELILISYVAVPGSSPPIHQAHTVKLKADGRRDTTFSIPAGRFLRIDQLAPQPDGKIVVAGTLGAKDYGAIVRLLPDGGPDPTFAGPTGVIRVDGFITMIGIQSDGRIVLGGEFQQVIGPSRDQRTSRQNIARLLADGTLDITFNPR